MKKVTVVICTYNRAKYLDLALQSLVDHTINFSQFNILVVDNNSKDNTKEIVEKHINKLSLKYIFEKKQGLSYARNRGINEVETEYIAYIDDDVKVGKKWVYTLINIINNDKPDVFGGPHFAFYEDSPPKWFDRNYGSENYGFNHRYLSNQEFISGMNMVFKRNILKKYHGFKTDLGMKGDKVWYGEETELQIRLRKNGIKIRVYPNLYVYHLVGKEKMSVFWLLRSKFKIQRSYEKIVGTYKESSLFRKAYNRLAFIKYAIILFNKYLFIERKKYKYWQNYVLAKEEDIISFFY